MLSADLVRTHPVLPEAPGTVTVLVITSDNAAYRRLESIFGHSKWHLHRVLQAGQAPFFLEDNPTPIVITEDGGWREALQQVSKFGDPAPRVIVASRLADDPLWQEVLEQGGYNVIRKPFDPAEVYWVVSNAWRDWKSASERNARTAYAAV